MIEIENIQDMDSVIIIMTKILIIIIILNEKKSLPYQAAY